MKKFFSITGVLCLVALLLLLSGCPTPTNNSNPTFTVTFAPDNNTTIAAQIITAGNKVTKPTPEPTKAGFVFDGWFTENTFATKWNFDTDTVTSDKTLYAKWVAETATFTVTFDTGSGSAVSSQTINNGGTVTKPATAPTNGSKKFGGWFTAATYEKPWNFTADTVTSDKTLYALWVDDIFTVSEGAIGVKNGATAIGHIFIPAELDGTAITKIASNAFENKILTAVTIPFGITEIDTNAFQDCSSLSSVVIPESVTSIGANAFINCALINVTIPASVSTIGYTAFAYNKNASLITITVLREHPPTIENDTFSGSSSSLKIYVPKNSSQFYTNSVTYPHWASYSNEIEELP